MGEQYSHLLIARDTAFVPRATQVSRFLAKITELGVLPPDAEMVLRTPSEKVRRGINPFTGEEVTFPSKDSRPIEDLAAFESAAAPLSDYEIESSASWTPQLPPIPVEVTDPYFIGVTCAISSVPRSTSHYVPNGEPAMDVVKFREPCESTTAVGIFTSPDDNSIIKVPEAGSARFWVEIELGKFLFPTLSDGSLDILAPEIVDCSEDIFGVKFAQGCCWG